MCSYFWRKSSLLLLSVLLKWAEMAVGYFDWLVGKAVD